MPVFREIIENTCLVPYRFAPAHRNRQSASAVAALGMEYFCQGKAVPAAEHAPDYLRLSQAERERLERVLAEPGGKEYGPLAILRRQLFEAEVPLRVPPR